MSKVRVHISTSLDGYVAGPNQSMEEPLGAGGEELHDWLVQLKAWREASGMEGGEESMGGGNFGPPARGSWGDDSGRGWWGEDPPFHKPVFVLTHHEREPLTLSDTTFTFVTGGIGVALEQARSAAAGKDVFLGGGASIINQYLAARLVHQLQPPIVPI